MAAVVDEELGQVEVAPVVGHAVELDERHLDLRMARRARSQVRSKDRHDVVHDTARDVEQSGIAGVALPGHGGLNQVAGAVQLVAGRNLDPAFCGSATW